MKPFKTELTAKEVKALVDYDPNIGTFRWKVKTGRSAIGKVAGTLTWPGYISICLVGHKYQAHRLAWLYMTGRWPTNEIDHINLDKTDNRFANLRVASKSQNKANCPKPNYGTNAHKGAYKRRNRWVANINFNQKTIYLGSFRTEALARDTYAKAAKRYFGEFARVT